jgi:hypothetical protein
MIGIQGTFFLYIIIIEVFYCKDMSTIEIMIYMLDKECLEACMKALFIKNKGSEQNIYTKQKCK